MPTLRKRHFPAQKIADNRTTHAIKRARERYNLTLNRSDLSRIKRMIQDHESNAITRASNSRVVHELVYQGQKLRLVYSSSSGQVVTFLPLDGDPDDERED